MIILIHTSKTMRSPATGQPQLDQPQLITEATELATYLKTLTPKQLQSIMQISPDLAATTHGLIATWTNQPDSQRPAIDAFLGDIYSGLQVSTWTPEDRDYANTTLRILSGLYGILRPLDGVYSYRFEMGYKLPKAVYSNLYKYWGEKIALTLPKDETIVNLAAVEYSKTVTPYLESDRIITPSFLTVSPKTKQPTFVTVHAKIARGAYANWLIKNRVTDAAQLTRFEDLNYRYDKQLSTPAQPVFVCQEFGGLGLSVRLT